jgi:M6 family metalloprotease-like protein
LCKTALVAGVAALALSAPAVAATYPSPAFDFAHPGSPHPSASTAGLYSPTGGNLNRPMLVVYASFTDTPFPAAMPVSTAASRFFGGFPSVRDYFLDEGGVDLSPAAESQGTANDGVVQVNIASDKGVFGALGIGDQNKQLLQAADPSVNFAAFDTNGDGTVTSAELVVQRFDADVDALPAGCGATRGHDAVTLDGKAISMALALDGTDTNLMTIIHETGHAAFGMRDLYGFGVGSFDISGPTCGAADSFFMRTSSWQKLHWGWITPTVVDRDGFVNVPRFDTSKTAYLLYDPDKNTENYFLVENRIRTAGTYDVSASDNGLLIWRIDDAQYGSGDETVRPIDIMRPDGTRAPGCAEFSSGCYGGSSIDAWDPSDGSTPQRTMSRTWRDGAASNVAVRAIGRRRSDGSIRAFLDVRGPGVLVDPYTLDVGGPVDVTPDEGNTISVPVMNTGEATDTFSFTFTGLPAGWTASTVTQTLAAGAGGVANIVLTPDANAPEATFTINVRGQSNSDSGVSSVCSLQVRIVLHETTITYTGATSNPWGEGAGFSATFTDADDGNAPIVGMPVVFRIDGSSAGLPVQPDIVTNTTSGAGGIATGNPTLSLRPGTYSFVVCGSRFGKHAAKCIFITYTVLKRPTTLVYSGVSTAEYSDPAALRATLRDGISSAPLAGKTIAFTLGSQGASGVTDSAGLAQATIVLNQAAATTTVSSQFAGDDLYLASSDSDPFTIDKEDLTLVYTGDTLVGLGTTPTLSAHATQEADGFPGDLSLGEVRFSLTPTLTAVPFSYLAALNAAGDGSVLAAGLPVDLWSVALAVPSSNGYWEGSGPDAELVVFDPGGQVNGGASGLDSAGRRVWLELNGRYAGDTPRGMVQLRSSAWRFKGDDYAWLVVVGNAAILELDGLREGAPMTLRLRLLDAGEPGRDDTFRAWLGPYASGVVGAAQGNLQVRSK